MATYCTENLRSIALLGHGGAGKTTLTEALLHAAGVISVRGSVDKGSTTSDFDAQEKSAGHSLYASLVHLPFAVDGRNGDSGRIQLIDTPGYPDFAGQALTALAGVDTAVVVVNAQTGIELNTERMMEAAEKRGLARMIVINKIDADNVDLAALVGALRARFGRQCLLLEVTDHARRGVTDVLRAHDGEADFDSVAHAHGALIEQLVEEDDSLLARYLDEGREPSPGELHAPFEKALRSGHLVPILFTSARTGAGVAELLHVMATLAPSLAEGNPPPFLRGEGAAAQAFAARPDPAAHVLAHVFKIIVDPYLGKLGVFRVHQGTLRKEATVFVGASRKPVKIAHLYVLQGKESHEVDALLPGAIGAVAKIDEVTLDSVLHDSHDEDGIRLAPLIFPQPMQGLAVETVRKSDEQRLFEVLHKLELEDPCFTVERHPHTHETVIRGLGEMHLRYKLERLATQYKLELHSRAPQVPYRETITAPAEGHCRHKKQSGGAGQFGEVYLRIEPLSRGAGIELVDQVKGGVIPGVFMPAVEKGVRQALKDGVVAGFPVEDLRVTVYDGKTHSVDGKEVAFFQAARKAAVAAIRAAAPVVLEPVMSLEILAPAAAIGELTGDLPARRGHVTGTEPRGAASVSIRGEVPLAEVADYASRLKSMTAGQGSYRLDFARYAVVPAAMQSALSKSFTVREDD